MTQKQTFCGDEKKFSQADVKDLRRISLREMQVRKHHRGHYLLVRTGTLVSKMVALNIAVIDPNGDAILLGLYNYPLLPLSLKSPPISDIDEILPLGTILLIKEPWCKLALQGPSALLRVDSPTDVLIVKEGDPLLRGVKWTEIMGGGLWKVPVEAKRTLDQWKTRGNKHFSTRLFLSAEKSYTLGIEQHPSHPDLHLLFLNRAAVNLTLERFNAALADSTKALSLLLNSTSLPPDKLSTLNSKAYHRRTSALYSLRRWSDAKDAFVEFLAAHPNSVEASVGLARTEARLREAATGDYNILELFNTSEKTPAKRMDVADFVGPVEVVSLEGRGRGIVTTRDVKAGELLLATKAIAMASPEDREPNTITVGLNLHTNKGESPEAVNLRSSLLYHLTFQPELLPLVTDLYPGPSFPPPSSSYSLLPPSPLQPGSPTPPLDVSLLEAAASYNTFNPVSPRTIPFEGEAKVEDSQLPIALFCVNSLLNHACSHVAYWSSFGDVQFIRATVDIAKGKEVTISYVGAMSYHERSKRLQKYLVDSPSKECDCELCEADRKDAPTNLDRRRKILERGPGGRARVDDDSPLPKIREELKRVEKEIEELQTTYHPDRGPFRPDLYPFFQLLGHLHSLLAFKTKSLLPHRNVIEAQTRALESLGVVLVDRFSDPPLLNSHDASLPVASSARLSFGNAVRSALQIAQAYLVLQKEEDGKSWVRAAMWMENVAIGGGAELFRHRYREILGGMEMLTR